jgi:hypothetical protein
MIIPAQRSRISAVVYELPVQAWAMDLTLGLIPASLTLAYQAFLASLDGPAGLIAIPDWDYERKRVDFGYPGGATGTITATGSKDAKTVALAGVGGTAPSFLAGSRLGVGGFVYQVTADTNRAGSAIAALPIRPRLRTDLSAAAVTLADIQFQMRLLDDAQGAVDIAPNGRGSAMVSLVEVLP